MEDVCLTQFRLHFFIFGLPGINFSSSIEQNLDDVYITSRCSKAERSVVRNIAVFLIGSPEQQ